MVMITERRTTIVIISYFRYFIVLNVLMKVYEYDCGTQKLRQADIAPIGR